MSDDKMLALLQEQMAVMRSMQQEIAKLKSERGEVPGPQPPPVVEGDTPDVTVIVDDYVATQSEGTQSKKTAKSNAKTLKETLVEIGKKQVRPFGTFAWDELSKGVIDTLYRPARLKAGVQPTTVNREVNTLQASLSWYVTLKKISHNPINGWEREPDRRRQTCPSLDTWKRFVSFGPPIYQDMMIVEFKSAGMRPGEVRLLKKNELRTEVLDDGGDHHEIVLPPRTKTGKARVIPVPDDVWTILQAYAATSRGPYVFVNPRDPERYHPIPRDTMSGWLIKCQVRSGMKGDAGENIVTYSSRHGGITDLLERGESPSSVSEAAGVGLKIMEQHYLHFGKTARRAMRARMNERGGLASLAGGATEKRKPAQAKPPSTPGLHTVKDDEVG